MLDTFLNALAFLALIIKREDIDRFTRELIEIDKKNGIQSNATDHSRIDNANT